MSDMELGSWAPEDQDPKVLHITQGIACDITTDDEYQLRSIEAEIGCYILLYMRQHRINRAVVTTKVEWPTDDNHILRYHVDIEKVKE